MRFLRLKTKTDKNIIVCSEEKNNSHNSKLFSGFVATKNTEYTVGFYYNKWERDKFEDITEDFISKTLQAGFTLTIPDNCVVEIKDNKLSLKEKIRYYYQNDKENNIRYHIRVSEKRAETIEVIDGEVVSFKVETGEGFFNQDNGVQVDEKFNDFHRYIDEARNL